MSINFQLILWLSVCGRGIGNDKWNVTSLELSFDLTNIVFGSFATRLGKLHSIPDLIISLSMHFTVYTEFSYETGSTNVILHSDIKFELNHKNETGAIKYFYWK